MKATNPADKVEHGSDGLVQVILTANANTANSPEMPPPVDMFIVDLLAKEGHLIAYRRLTDANATSYRALAEFADADVALVVAARLNGVIEQVRTVSQQSSSIH